MMFRTIIFVASLLGGLTAMASGNHAGSHGDQAIGKPGLVSQVTRTVRLDMNDAMRFQADLVEVKAGETVRFVVKNSGQLKHEMVLGTAKDLQQHNEIMKKHPDMAHADANMVTVAPGKTGEIIWQFTQAGKVNFACLQPGHYAAGMKGLIKVAGEPLPLKQARRDQASGQAPHDHGFSGQASKPVTRFASRPS